ncbi:hypothetical protein N7466_010212 [Penicillium verhagenii]|uniref:uncharacterized protein n=1 Tax=Penicillium verhagenii TaxID=1562060 RepID=UPI0025454FE4|nr:uncharacterized protein N7466_010212 [Penicillium verhagenii]KAJ5919269.1 hypothetical protein N7466_010212 [Penicillium verhagenii]
MINALLDLICTFSRGVDSHALTFAFNKTVSAVSFVNKASWTRTGLPGQASVNTKIPGYNFMLSGSPISWQSLRRNAVTMSSTEAEKPTIWGSCEEASRNQIKKNVVGQK